MKTATMLRQQIADHRAEVYAQTITDPIEQIRFLRQRASASGSFVAAKDLHRDEMALVAARDADEKRKAEQAAKDIPALLDEMDRILTDMPESLRWKVVGKWMPDRADVN